MSEIGKRKRNENSKRYVALKYAQLDTRIVKGFSLSPRMSFSLSFKSETEEYELRFSLDEAKAIQAFLNEHLTA